MDWLVDRVFPFRRLTIWLAVLVFAVSAISLTLSFLLVLPSLDENLVSNRVSIQAQAAKTSAPTFVSSFASALSGRAESADTNAVTAAYGTLTNTQAAVYQAITRNQLVPVTTPAPTTVSPVALQAATEEGVQSGVGTISNRRVAEAAYSMRIDNTHYVVLLQSNLDDIDSTVALTSRRSLLGALIALPLAVLVGALAAALLTRRVRRLERSSSLIAAGNLSTPIRDRGRDEIGELAVALDRMRNELAATDAARRTFVANASHELRTPVFALSGFLELLIDEEDEATRRQFLATMQDQANRLTRLATDLLDLSRLDAGKVAVEQEPVELATVAERTSIELAPIAARRGTIITTHAKPAMAIGDEARIGQIIRVLIDNAVRHNPPGVQIDVRTALHENSAAVIVEDTGPQIPDSEARVIFTRFARGMGAGEGSGLGLAIASELAERMGGQLVLDQSGPNKSFRLELPADKPVV